MHGTLLSAAVFATLLLVPSMALGGDPQAGRDVYLGQCISCHSVECHRPYGPALGGVFGRTAGTQPDFRYSQAMRDSGIVWDETTIDEFLTDPSTMLPGTIMRDTAGVRADVPNAEDRHNLIAYLLSGDTSLDLC